MDRGGSKQPKVKKLASRSSLNNYYRGSATPAASPFEKKKPIRTWRTKLAKITDLTVLAVILLCLIYSLIVSPDPKVIITSNIYQPQSVYQNAAAKTMAPLKDRSKLTFDEASVVTTLQRQFPEISLVNVELPLFGQRPVVRLKIARPQFVFSSGGQVYVLADNGLIIQSSIKKPSIMTLPLIIDQSGFKAEPGKAVLSAQQVTFIVSVVNQLNNAKVPILSFTLPNAAQEIDLRTKDKNYFIKFYLAGDSLVQTGQFLAARHQFLLNHHDPTQYLDVRIVGKIFYK